jgi:hypothetical protein
MERDTCRGCEWRWVAFLLAGVLAADPAAVHADQVVESGFCRKVAERVCADALPDGTRVRMTDLDTDAAGHRVIYFHATLAIEHAKYFVLSIGRGPEVPPGGEARARVQAHAALGEDVLRTVGAFRVGNVADVLNVVVEATQNSPHYRAVGVRYVHSYGPLVATVVNPEGEEFPGSSPKRIEIIP